MDGRNGTYLVAWEREQHPSDLNDKGTLIMTHPSILERVESTADTRADARCSICAEPLNDGTDVRLDVRPYNDRSGGDDWRWHHRKCEALRL